MVESYCYQIRLTKQAQKDAKKIKAQGLENKVIGLLNVLKTNPFQNPPSYEKLIGDLDGAYSRRITIQHRLVYQVDSVNKRVKILRLWTHYE